MNWPMIFVGLVMLFFGYLIWTTIRTDDQYRKRMAIKKHYEDMRTLGIPPEQFEMYKPRSKH